MTYFKVTEMYIYNLRNKLTRFFTDVLYEINRQERDEIEDAKNEANDDKLYERYDPDSVDKWLIERIDYLNNWAEKTRSELNSDYHRALNILEKARYTKFYESDLGYEFEIDLYKSIIKKSRIQYEDNSIRVFFTGLFWDVDGKKFEFEPDVPNFTDWIED